MLTECFDEANLEGRAQRLRMNCAVKHALVLEAVITVSVAGVLYSKQTALQALLKYCVASFFGNFRSILHC